MDSDPTVDDAGDVVRGERFSGGPAREMLSSLAADERIFEADIAVDRAHAVMLAEQGIVSRSEVGTILAALGEVEAAGHAALPEGEDVHAAIETAVIDRVGPPGGKMHTARSRNDEVATCIRYRLRSDLLAVTEATLALRTALVGTAADHVDSVMPGYTHLQPAQPTTLGHHLASYEGALARDTERLLDAYDRVNRSPLGAAAFAGTAFDVDRERTAALLGFDDVIENATDAVSARDFVVETLGALAAQATTLSGLAEDLIVLAKDGHFTPSDDYASTSSIMPQKVNPDTLELVRATAGDVHAGLSGVLTILKGLPRAYNRDLQRVTPHAWQAVDAVTEATEVAAGAVETATWDTDSLAAEADAGASTATGIADLLAGQGVPFRTAHDVVATAAEGNDVLSYDALATAAEDTLDAPLSEYVTPGAVREALDPYEGVVSRDSSGGPAPDRVEASLATARSGIVADETAVTERRRSLAAAATELEETVTEYV